MVYEVVGILEKTGKPVRARVEAASPQAALAKAAKHGVRVEPGTVPQAVEDGSRREASGRSESEEAGGPTVISDEDDVARLPKGLVAVLCAVAVVVVGGTVWWVTRGGAVTPPVPLPPGPAMQTQEPSFGNRVSAGEAAAETRAGVSEVAKGAPEREKLANAAATDATALYMRGIALLEGDGVPQSDAQAAAVMQQAAEAGLTAAMYRLGKMQVGGEAGSGASPEAGVAWLKRAAERGHSDAMIQLGLMSSHGSTVAEDAAAAAAWYRRAADAGNPAGMRLLAEAYEGGRGVEADIAEAVHWYKLAADRDDASANVTLEALGRKVVNSASAAYENDAAGMVNLGVYYSNGDDLKKDDKLATAWFRKGALAGNKTGMYYLAMNLEKGEGVERDLAGALEWYKKAGEAGHAKAMFKAGELYSSGVGVSQDLKAAREWWERAAAAGLPVAMYNMGAIYANGEGVERNREKAVEWLRKAHAAGHDGAAEALRQLGEKP